MIQCILIPILLASIEFPMESHGKLCAYKFFETNTEHFVYGTIIADVKVTEIGRFSWHLGLGMDTYMGESWNNPAMKFNIYGGHWNITTQFDYMLPSSILLRVYTDHECFHNIDMADTVSEYMNNIKLGALYTNRRPEFYEKSTWLPGHLPDTWLTIGFYRPRGGSFQKGHDFNWSIHQEITLPIFGIRHWVGGVRQHGDFYFHNDGSASSRHLGELFFLYNASAGQFEAHLTHIFHDSQPFRSLDGQSYWGIRFIW